MPDTQVQSQTVDVHGPDGKLYKFPKGTTKDRAISYFKKKGIGVKARDTPPKSNFVPSGPDPDKVKESMTGGMKQNVLSGIDYASKELPAIGGAGFGLAAGGKTNPVGVGFTTLGGSAGQAGNEIIQRLVFNRSGSGIPTGSKDDTNYNTVKDIVLEGLKQGGLELISRNAGDIFFHLLNKIPHAEIKNGIRLLPSDLNGGKITRYVEDLLTNLIPSAETMNKFKAGQNKDVIGAADKLAKGFSRFRGTTEEMGKLLQDTYRSLEYDERKALAIQAKGLKNPKDIYKTAEYSAYVKNFKSELAGKIAETNKPELIGGYLRSSSSLQETRDMVSLLEKEKPKVMNSVRTRLLQDTLQEALTGQTDPVLKDIQKQGVTFSGSKFKQALDKIGEDKLKAIYGQNRYDNLMEFSKLIQHVGGTSGVGAGKFLNLIFLISPLRYGISLTTGRHILVEGIAFNRAAKIMTSTEGVRLYENFIRASSIGAVKGISAARDALKTYIDHQDAEYIKDQQQIEDQYYKDHPDEKKYLDEQKAKDQKKQN